MIPAPNEPNEPRAQQGYYDLPSAAAVLAARIDAIAKTLRPGTSLLDIGCNDGSIAKGLLSRGVASRVHGVDLENITQNTPPEFTFSIGNLLTMDLKCLPPADGVLVLNVLHHIIAADEGRAVEVLDWLLAHYEFVIVDLGSKSEVGDWGWRKRYDELYRDDKQLWDTLFASAAWRFKLLRYPAQGGHRVLWKLYKSSYSLDDLTSNRKLVRTEGSWPSDKKLIESGASVDCNIAPTVSYEILISGRRDLFFRKTYSIDANPRLARYEFELAQIASSAFANLASFGVEERHLLRIARPCAYGKDNSITFLFEPDLLECKPSHYQDWMIFLDSESARAAFILACAEVCAGSLPRAQLLSLADFQVAKSWNGLVALDFEPNSLVVEFPNDIFQVEAAN
jgi:hypothetical protein